MNLNIVKIRPAASYEANLNKDFSELLTSVEDGSKEIDKKLFDAVLTSHSNNDVYDKYFKNDILNWKITGDKNLTILAYGTTGSGKTQTMFGDGVNDKHGIVQLSVNDIFDIRPFSFASVEIHMSQQKCLLTDHPTTRNAKIKNLSVIGKKQKRTSIIASHSFTPTIITVNTKSEALDWVNYARDRRRTKSNNSNISSSRSHLIITIIHENGGILRFVDCAGYEDSKKYQW